MIYILTDFMYIRYFKLKLAKTLHCKICIYMHVTQSRRINKLITNFMSSIQRESILRNDLPEFGDETEGRKTLGGGQGSLG